MTKDIELLQDAAKAIGYKLQMFGGSPCIKVGEFAPQWHPWNPLQSDGDALRLANALQLCISIGRLDGTVTVTSANNSSIYCAELYLPGESSCKATRVAITTAAAAIAKVKGAS